MSPHVLLAIKSDILFLRKKAHSAATQQAFKDWPHTDIEAHFMPGLGSAEYPALTQLYARGRHHLGIRKSLRLALQGSDILRLND